MTWWQALLLVVGGFFAGGINAVAGGGSTLTVPLLVLAGVPGTSANGSNRVGILASNFTAAAGFRRLGVQGVAESGKVIVPAVIGSIVGSFAIAGITDEAFETIFGLLMIPMIVLSIRKPKVRLEAEPWSRATTVVVFFLIGIYGGAIQAGVGLVIVAALTRAGFDLLTANNIKVLITFAVTAVALPVFIAHGQVEWVPALILAAGFAAGGWVGAHVAVKKGEKYIRAMMIAATVVLAGSLLGLY